MIIKLTDRFCHTCPAGEYFDSLTPGLALRVGLRRRSWQRHFTREGKRVREWLGLYPAMSLAEARRIAIEGPGEAVTLRSVCEDWLRREGEGLRSAGERRSVFERHVYPRLGQRPIEAIKRSEVAALLDGVEDGSGPVAADKTLAFLAQVFNWHAARSDDFRSPIVRGMARTKPKDRERERTLTDAEVKALWATDCPPGLEVFHRYVKFLLLTAVRRTEASEGHERELVGGNWTIPKERMKGKLEFVVPLSASALALIGEGPFWFGGVRPISAFSKLKSDLDEVVPIAPWRLHDLRRTARSLMSRAGVLPDIAERCLAHKIGGVRGIYDRWAYLAEKKEALKRLAELVGEITKD